MTLKSPGLHRFDVSDPLHGSVPCAALVPHHSAPSLPLCLFLYGGGGSRESLADLQPAIESWWEDGLLPPMLMATPDVGAFSFYLDDPARGLFWESFVAERFVPHLRRAFPVAVGRAETGLVGISMGGYGALKLAFGRPHTFGAVAAVSPMLEPATEADTVRLRNRFHYPPEVPQALLGEARDAALYRADHPANRARSHAETLRSLELPIYLDAAGADALNAHDGAEFLHRVLWDLDVRHEYHLLRDADHVGPELVDRLRNAFAWVGCRMSPPTPPALTETEAAWQAWLHGESKAPPSAVLAPTSRLFPRVLRAQLAPLRAQAEADDPTVSKHYG